MSFQRLLERFQLTKEEFAYRGVIVACILGAGLCFYSLFLYQQQGKALQEVMQPVYVADLPPSVQLEFGEGDRTYSDPYARYYLPIDFAPLKEKNEEIVAWLTYAGTSVDLPVTQTTNNDFYLEHDAWKRPNKLGAVFVDVRSSLEYMGLNTVLYGHNVTANQMFGNLKSVLEATPETKEDFLYIQIATPTRYYVFETIAVYITEYEDWRYVQQRFDTDLQKQKFLDQIQENNVVPIFEPKKPLSIYDNYLTFSTCYGPVGTDKRLVVHSRLVTTKDRKTTTQ